MKIYEKYLETLKEINGWITISEWAVKFSETHPDLLASAHKQAISQKKPSTGLREIAARMGSAVATGTYEGHIEVDASERPRKVRYVSEEEATRLVEREIEEDAEPLNRADRIAEHQKSLNQMEVYRIDEIVDIAKTMSRMFRLDFEVDHAAAILNESSPGRHHPDNLQILTKSHNVRKSNSNWVRFTFEEQVEYMKTVIKVQKIIEIKMAVEIDDSLIENIISRLKLVF